MLTPSFLNQARTHAELAARRAGETLLAWQARFSVREKGIFDLVTEADEAAQQCIQSTLLGAFPGHHFLGEETPESESLRIDARQPLWVVDPLDGTTNYVHGFPAYSISIGLVFEGKPVVGVIFDPTRNELFSAIHARGASLNGHPIGATKQASLAQSLLAVGFPANLRGNEIVIDAWQAFGYRTQGLRRTGSSALNLAYIAAGRLDGFFAFQQCPWDVAAGMLLVQEAGGQVTQHDGSLYHVLDGPGIVASNGLLHGEIIQQLATLHHSAQRGERIGVRGQ